MRQTYQMVPRSRAKGHWGVSLSSLSVADCGAPAELKHGLVTFSTSNNLTTYKSEVRYSCQQPYYKMFHNITGEPLMLNQTPRILWVSGLDWGLKHLVSWTHFEKNQKEKHSETCFASLWLRPLPQELGYLVPWYLHKTHSQPPAEKDPLGRWKVQSVLPLPQTSTKKIL